MIKQKFGQPGKNIQLTNVKIVTAMRCGIPLYTL